MSQARATVMATSTAAMPERVAKIADTLERFESGDVRLR